MMLLTDSDEDSDQLIKVLRSVSCRPVSNSSYSRNVEGTALETVAVGRVEDLLVQWGSWY